VLEEALNPENPSRGKFVAKRGFNFEDMTARKVQRNAMPVNGCELTRHALRLVLFALFDVQSDASPNGGVKDTFSRARIDNGLKPFGWRRMSRSVSDLYLKDGPPRCPAFGKRVILKWEFQQRSHRELRPRLWGSLDEHWVCDTLFLASRNCFLIRFPNGNNVCFVLAERNPRIQRSASKHFESAAFHCSRHVFSP
jgi:hypothetical protein